MPSDITRLQRANAQAARRARELGSVTPEFLRQLTEGSVLREDLDQAALVRRELGRGERATPEQIAAVGRLVEEAGAPSSWGQPSSLREDRRPEKADWFARTVLKVFQRG